MRRFTIALVLAAASGLAACGGGDKAQKKKTGPDVAVVLGAGVVDQDTPAGVVASFEARLAKTAVDDELHAPTLESLAIAHIEFADSDGDTPEARAAREQAVVRFGELVDLHPTYVGAPSALLMRSFEQGRLGDTAGAVASLEQLVSAYPADDFAVDGRLALADMIVRETPDRAQALYEAVIAAESASERASYARYQLAAIRMGSGDAAAAFELLGRVATDSATDPRLADQARIVAAHVWARTEGATTEGAPAALGPLARNEAELAALVEIVGNALAAPSE